jgi:DNA-binding transcriptional MerR regulator
MTAEHPSMFFTADIATLLKIPEWRVIKFAMGSEYGITPSHNDASGSGTRRVYSIENVCQIALALRLLDSGLSSKAIGRILRALQRKEPLSAQLSAKSLTLEDLYLLIFRTPKSRRASFWSGNTEAFFVSSLTEAIEEQGERPTDDLLLISVGPTFRVLKHRLSKWQKVRGR